MKIDGMLTARPLRMLGVLHGGIPREEAFKNIREVVEMIIEELIEDGEYIPEALENEVQIFSETRVMVTA